MDEHRRLQKDDLPAELWPMWDQLQALAAAMEASHRSMLRAQRGWWMAAGACLTATICNVAVVIIRAL